MEDEMQTFEEEVKVYEDAPQEVKDIIDSFDEMNNNYFSECKRVISELEPHGYIMDYDMSGELFNLTKIEPQ